MKASIAAVLSTAFAVLAQEGNDTAPFPNTTYPDAISPNPLAVAGAQSNQTSPPGYPSPWSSGKGDWAAAHEKAVALVSQLTLEEKVNLTTGEFRHVMMNRSSCDTDCGKELAGRLSSVSATLEVFHVLAFEASATRTHLLVCVSLTSTLLLRVASMWLPHGIVA